MAIAGIQVAFSILVALVLKNATGSWHAVLLVTALMNFLVVALALLALKPLRSRQITGGAQRLAVAIG